MRENKSPIARFAALGALIAAIVLVLLLLFSGGGEKNTYKLLFETGGQLVQGNEVRIGGVPVGSVEKIDLTEDNQAEVTITTEQPLTEGTEAVIRLTSLSGVANRYISVTPGPNNAPELELDGAAAAGRHGRPGRHRPALRHLPAASPAGAAAGDRGAGGHLRRSRARGQPRLQVLQLRASPRPRSCSRSSPATSRSSPTSSSTPARSSTRSPRAAATSPRSSRTRTRRSARSPGRTARSTASSSRCRRPSASRTRPS